MTCARCGVDTPRLTVDQRYCPPCRVQTDALIAADALRRAPRFRQAKDLTGMTGTVL